MDPTRLLPPDGVSFMRYPERHGNFAHQHLLGLYALRRRVGGAKDTLSLLLVMLDQVAQDASDTTLAWLVTLQAPPPAGLFRVPPTVPGSSLGQRLNSMCS